MAARRRLASFSPKRSRRFRISKFDKLLDMAVSSILYQTPNNRPTDGHHSPLTILTPSKPCLILACIVRIKIRAPSSGLPSTRGDRRSSHWLAFPTRLGLFPHRHPGNAPRGLPLECEQKIESVSFESRLPSREAARRLVLPWPCRSSP